jgi:serine/threonine-protein kinase
MQNTLSNGRLAFFSGDFILGRWTQQRYIVIKTLGSGGFGTVQLVEDVHTSEYRALKISRDMLSLVREFTILQKLNQVSIGGRLAPKVDFLDDWQVCRDTYSFIVMEYVEGENLRQLLYKQKFTMREIYMLARLLGALLLVLHSIGYAYCDLKPENIIYDRTRAVFRLVDFGGVRDIGSAVVQFTPAYDRATYGCGTRQADPGYDVFALTALMITLATGKDPHACEERKLPWELAVLWRRVRRGNLSDMSGFLRECERFLHSPQEPIWFHFILVYGVAILSAIIFGLTLVYLVVRQV